MYSKTFWLSGSQRIQGGVTQKDCVHCLTVFTAHQALLWAVDGVAMELHQVRVLHSSEHAKFSLKLRLGPIARPRGEDLDCARRERVGEGVEGQ